MINYTAHWNLVLLSKQGQTGQLFNDTHNMQTSQIRHLCSHIAFYETAQDDVMIYSAALHSLAVKISLTRPAPALVVSTIFIFHIETPRADFIMDLVVAVYFDMRIHYGYHL